MKNLKVMIIDDMDSMRSIITFMLKSFGISSIDEHYDTKRSLRLINSEDQSPYDLIICDWFMPSMTGEELLQNIRSNDKLSRVKFLMTIDESEQNDILMATQKGADNFIVKPFSSQQLKEKLALLFPNSNFSES